MCIVLEVSRSGYYRWVKARESKRRKEDRELLEMILAIYKKSRKIYGAPRIHRELQKQGVRCGQKRVARLMRESGIRGKCKRRFKPKTTDSNHGERVFPNLLPDVIIERPDQVWAADITYIATKNGWVYLATVIDLYSRKIVGWSIASHRGTRSALRRAGQIAGCLPQYPRHCST